MQVDRPEGLQDQLQAELTIGDGLSHRLAEKGFEQRADVLGHDRDVLRLDRPRVGAGPQQEIGVKVAGGPVGVAGLLQ